MRLIWIAIAAALMAAGLTACGTGKEWHTQRALQECQELMDPAERMACEQNVRDERWARDAEARSKENDEETRK